VVQRYGADLLAAIARGEGIPDSDLPVYPKQRRPHIGPVVQRRRDALAGWRARSAEKLGMDPGVLLPRRLIERLAESMPADPDSLAQVEGIRRWRIQSFGQEILQALASPAAPDPPQRREVGVARRRRGVDRP
jgi:ribonuclease D